MARKPVHLNRFYQSYIADKQHVHMNATRFSSLTELAKYLGKEGKCRVTEEDDKGMFIAWIDNSPDALQRRDAVEKRGRLAQSEELCEQKRIQAQIERAWQTTSITSTEHTSVAHVQDRLASQPTVFRKFELPQRQADPVMLSSKKRPKNVFSTSKRRRDGSGQQSSATVDQRGAEGCGQDSPNNREERAIKKRRTLDLEDVTCVEQKIT